ncbi:hypothetical protein J6590_071102 [Homalodisca vitripennis]|nr:hypothetical protein J6590_071102 [Homalodisca vitripennis]
MEVKTLPKNKSKSLKNVLFVVLWIAVRAPCVQPTKQFPTFNGSIQDLTNHLISNSTS